MTAGVQDLINAIASGDAQAIEQSFASEMATRISERLDDMRIDVAQNMFQTESKDCKSKSMKKEEIEEDLEEEIDEELDEEEIDEELDEEVMSKKHQDAQFRDHEDSWYNMADHARKEMKSGKSLEHVVKHLVKHDYLRPQDTSNFSKTVHGEKWN